MGFKLEDTIVPPPLTTCNNGKWPFNEMEVGQSFFIPETDTSAINAVHGRASADGKRLGKKFTVRTVGGGKRCWRIA